MQQKVHNLFLTLLAAALSATAVSSCMKSDTPTADVKGVFIEFEAEGQKKASINAFERTVVVDLLETVDPKNVKITKVVLPEPGVCDIAEGSVIDLSAPLKVKIKTIAEYEWTISSTQNIERVFEIADQVGAAWFEVSSHSVFAYVPEGTDMSQITVKNIKLGPGSVSDGITEMTPDLNGQTVNFMEAPSGVRQVEVKYWDKTETWKLYVGETETGMNDVARSDIWATFATVTAAVLESDSEIVEFGYRKAGGDEWQYITAVAQGTYDYSARITRLTPDTPYEVSLWVDDAIVSEPKGFTTEPATQPRNAGLEEYGYSGSGDNKIGYYFYSNLADKYWDCGNKGSMTLNGNVTTPSTDVRQGVSGISSAYLKSQFVGIGLGKFAAGNLYSGDYAGTSGTNGYINFGREHTSRPTSLRFWYKAEAGVVDYGSSEAGIAKGDSDKYRVFVVLTDWSGEQSVGTSGNPTAPAEGQKQIYTGNTSTFIDWYTDPGIIAFGELISSDPVTVWTQHTIDLKYRSTERMPTGIVIMTTSSMYGDYFAGSTDSYMYIDDVELIYNDRIVLQD